MERRTFGTFIKDTGSGLKDDGSGLYVDNTVFVTYADNGTNLDVDLGSGSITTGNLLLDTNTLSSTNTDGDILLTPDGAGVVGIGLSDPKSKLHINGRLTINDSNAFELMANAYFPPGGVDRHLNTGASGRIEFIATAEEWRIETAPSGAADTIINDFTTRMFVRNTDVTIPTQLNVDNIRIDGNTISSTDTDGNIILSPDGSGNVGIGTTTPDELTHIAGAVDGRFTGLLIENTQADAAASTNETAEMLFGFAGKNNVARISADKLKDYTSAPEEDSRLSFWVDVAGTLTEVFHVMPDGIMLKLGDSRIRFAGTADGGGQSIQYKDLSGSNRAAMLFPGSDLVVLCNRTEDGVVELRANTSTGGAAGEVTVAAIKDRRIDLVSGQLQFPATQLASADVNTLDDYREGTFTPIAIFAAGSGTITYTTQLGRYTKIGNIVFFSIDLKTLSIASRTGVLHIGGMPFTSAAVPGSSVCVGFADGVAITANTSITGSVNAASTLIAMRIWDSTGGPTTLQDTEWTDDGHVLLSGHYHV